MNDATSTTIMDSTAGGHTGQKDGVGNPMETPDGKIGKAQDFNQDGITIDNSDDFSMTDGVSDVPFTFDVWINPTAINNHHNLLTKDGQEGREYYFEIYGAANPRFVQILLLDNNAGTYISAKYYYNFQTNIWYQLTVTYDGSGSTSGFKLYLNGVPTAWSETSGNGYIKMRHTTTPLFMAKYNYADPKYYYGIMDEVRVSKGITRDLGWISTSYLNQNDPASFISVGPEEPGP